MVKVSIIIPCYNGSDFIKPCIESINKDKLAEKEIIFVNDGSTDNSLETLKKYEEKYKNIIVINQKNSGQGAARNKALKKAKGEFIFFLDIDDYVEKDIFYKMYNYAKKNNYDYVYCDYYEHYENYDKLIINKHSSDVRKDVVLANFAPWGKLISHKLIKDNNFEFCEGKIYEDIAVIPHLATKACNPGYFNKPMYFYNMTNTSTTRTKEYKEKYEDIIYVSDYMYNLFKNDNLIDKYYDELEYIYLDSILKSGVITLAKYKEGLNKVSILRANVKEKFPNLIHNKYLRQDSLYRRITAFISVYFPKYLIYLLKNVKRKDEKNINNYGISSNGWSRNSITIIT